MRPKEAIVLAGGLGTRLQSVIHDIPKPMAPIGDVPFLEYILNYLKSYRIEHIILSVGHKWESISNYFGDTYKDMAISYAVETTPLGTGGGIKLAMEKMKGDHVYIINGDTFFNVDLHDLSEFYFAHKSDIAMTVKMKRDFFRYGTVDLDISRVTGFREKTPVRYGLINGGVYLTSKSLFSEFDLGVKFSFESDFLEKYLNNLKVNAMRCSEYFIDIGVPADYERACKELPRMNEVASR